MHRQKYVILIAFPWQQWLFEHPSLLRYTYVACVVIYIKYRRKVALGGSLGIRSGAVVSQSALVGAMMTKKCVFSVLF
jgi:hypothetical protein